MSESAKKTNARDLLNATGLDVAALGERLREGELEPEGRPEAIGEILGNWLVNGRRSFLAGGHNMPWEPSLHYRMTGEWEGWEHFFGAPPSMENRLRDRLEGEAWRVWLAMWQTIMGPDD